MQKPIFNIHCTRIDEGVKLTWLQSSPFFDSGVPTDEFDTFSIFRQEVDFQFGKDYLEYFYNTCCEASNPIFQGPIKAENHRKYTFIDTGVQVGKTYSYFIQTQTSCPIGPFPVRIRSRQVWWSYEKIRTRIDGLAERYPDIVETVDCGKTVLGKNIPAAVVGKGQAILALVGIVHGGESGPELIIPAVEKIVESHRELLEQIRLVVVPGVNLDAREKMVQGEPRYIRMNCRGVDLNRNFPSDWDQIDYSYGEDTSDPTATTYRGPSPASEPETQGLMSLFNRYQPAVMLSYHWLASVCSFPGLVSQRTLNNTTQNKMVHAVMDAFAKGFPDIDFNDKCIKFKDCPGSLRDWLYNTFGTIAIDIEGGMDSVTRQCANDSTDDSIITQFQEIHYKALFEVMKLKFSD